VKLSAFPQPRHLLLFALGWTTFAVYGSLVPLQYQPVNWAVAIDRFRNLPPLWYGMGARADWVANILLFVPLAILWMGALSCDRGWLARIAAAAVVIPACFAGAVALEFTQIWFDGRTVSRNDILAEAIGSVLGALLWLGVGQQLVEWVRSYGLDRSPASRIGWLLLAYVVGFIVYSLIPLDLTISFTELYKKYEKGQVILIPFSYPYGSVANAVYQLAADILVFVPVGAWLAHSQAHRRRHRSLVLFGIAGGVLFALGLEILQALIVSRYSDATDIVLSGLGAGLGAWLITRFTPSGANALTRTSTDSLTRLLAPGIVLLAYSAILAIGFWFPFEISRDRLILRHRLELFFQVPFNALYQGSEFNAIKQVLVRLLLFAPVGVLWAHLAHLAASSGIRRVVLFAGVIYSAGLAAGIELAQIFMPEKIADSTEILFCVVGALAGLAIANGVLRAKDQPVDSGPP